MSAVDAVPTTDSVYGALRALGETVYDNVVNAEIAAHFGSPSSTALRTRYEIPVIDIGHGATRLLKIVEASLSRKVGRSQLSS